MRFLLPLLLLALLTACASTPAPTPTPPAPVPTEKPAPKPEEKPAENVAIYHPATWSELPGWPGHELQASWSAWLTSCERLQRRSDRQALCAESVALGPQPDPAAIQAFFENRFQPWRIESSLNGDIGLVTGYYEALLSGGRDYRPGRVPLYAEPDDLLTIDLAGLYPDLKGMRLRGRLEGKKVLPYWSRDDINQGKGPGPNKVLVWADDPIDAFFLEIQGSGRVQLEDGSMVRIGYANQNGHPYRSIGRWLADQGEIPIEQVSMQRIRAWAQANPARLRELLSQNPSYVFFRLVPDNGRGAIGALNVPLTAGASIAVDPKFTPLGSPVWLDTTYPSSDAPLQRLVQAQDTGGAIRGPVRADFFWGFGHEAGAQAGTMKQKGRMWLLLPQGELPPARP